MKIQAPLPVAEKVARHLLGGLRSYPSLLARVEIAGSIRRSKSEVGDIEIVDLAGR